MATDSTAPPTYPASRPFPSRFASRCAWSGRPIAIGDTVRAIIDGFDAETQTEVNKRFVAERFVHYACTSDWRLISTIGSLDAVLADGARYYLLTDRGTVDQREYRFDGDRRVFSFGLHTRSIAQFRRSFDNAIAVLIVQR